MRRTILIFSTIICGSAPVASTYGAEDYTTWSSSQRIVLNTTSSGANVPLNVLKFPVLLRLNPGNFSFFSQTQPGGADIRFAKTNGVHLPYQIERWADHDGNSDTAEIWVLCDTVYGDDSLESFVMYWGKTGAADSSNGGAVFSNGFLGAWHLQGNLADATGNGNNGTDSNTVDTASGLIGRARAFNGSSQYFNVGDLPDRPSGTISCWFRPKATFSSSSSSSQGIWGKKESDSYNATLSLRGTDFGAGDGSAGELQTKIENNNAGVYISSSTATFTAGTWYHVAWSWGNSTDVIYVNGTSQGTASGSYTVAGVANDEIGRSLYDASANLPGGGPKYFNGSLDEFRIDATVRSASWINLCYKNQQKIQTLVTLGKVTTPLNHTWDTSSATGTQAGSGIWGTSNFWSSNGTNLTAWPGRGYTALFTGNEGAYTITVRDTQYVDSITVRTNTYTFTDGTINLGSKSGIYIATGITSTIGSVIAGSGGLAKYGRGTLVLSGANTYTGPTRISLGTLSTELLANGGSNSNLGASANSAENLVISSAALIYTGGEQSCDRLFTVGAGGATITASGTGALSLTNTGSMARSGSGARTLTLNGTNTGNNTLAAVIANYSSTGTTAVTKNGTGKWILSATSTYTGVTTVSAGTLIVNGVLASGSAVTVSAGAVIGGSGTIAGTVNASGATITPGNDGPGKLRTGALTLSSASIINLEIGSSSDTIAVTGALKLNGTVNITPAAGFAPGKYRIMTCSGTLTNDTLTAGSLPKGMSCTFEYSAGYVSAVFATRLIQTEPADTAVIIGHGAGFSVTADGEGTLSYLWQRFPSPVSIGTEATYSIASVVQADTNALFRCIVTDSFSSDTSRWALLSIVDTPRVVVQPHDTSVIIDEKAVFSVTLADTTRCTYEWRKVGSSTSLGSTNSYSIAAAATSHEGDYYCLITNSVATISTDTVHLTVRHIPPEAEFSYSPKTGILPLEVSFTDLSSGTITSYKWKFGDGNGDTVANPKHIYTATGNYAVRLTVTGPGGVDSTDTVHVNVIDAPPIAQFDFSPKTGTIPLEVSFTDSSSGVITSRKWNFDDGEGDTIPNPTHSFTNAGQFTVRLTVTGPGGVDSTDAVVVAVKSAPPEARFGFSPESGMAPLEVTFTDSSSGTVTSRHWNFGDESGDTVRNPAHVYMAAGTYTVTLRVSGPGGTDSIVKERSITVFDESQTSLQNALRMEKLLFDSASAAIRVAWCIDTAQFSEGLEVGIAYSLDNYPTEMDGNRIVTVYTPCTDTTVLLSEPLRFDTLYHIALFVRRQKEEWPEPTDQSRDTVRTGHPYRQVVTFFVPQAKRDTVTAFNDRILLWKDRALTDTTWVTDTLAAPAFTPPEGFSVAGIPVKFLKAGPVLPLYIGIRIDSLPPGASMSDVRIYRDSAGVITVEHATLVDSVNKIVYVKTADIRHTIIAMVDHRRPEVSILSPIDSLAHSERDIVDSFSIADNIANVRWAYLYSRGDEPPTIRDSGELRATCATVNAIISKSSQIISSEFGVRILLVISDAAHRDTFDLSRSVFRDKSDEVTTVAETWHPLYPTACLFETDPDSLIVAAVEGKEYDTRYMRLFRWVETAANSADDEKWVEYDPSDKNIRPLFSLVQGRLLWLKTLKNTPLHFGKASTYSLKDTFTIELPPHQFTDFGMPFRFGVRIGDILAASGHVADSVQFYLWSRDAKSNLYRTVQLYIPAMSDKMDRSTILKFRDRGGYSLYNPYDDPVTLRIPPTLGEADDQPDLGKQVKDPSWSAKLITTTGNGSDLPALYCGYAPGIKKSTFPVSPTFEQLRVFVIDRSAGKKYGHAITADAAGGLAEEVRISNSSDSAQRITYRFETVGNFPKDYSAHLFDVTSGQSATSGDVTIEPHSAVSRWFIVGDREWHDRFVTSAGRFSWGLQRLYPNPARSTVTIRYSVPLGGQERLTFTIFDIKGRKVWEKRIDALLSPGYHLISWDGRDLRHRPVSAGMYPVRLTVVNNHGKTVGQFERRLTYFP